MKCKMSTGQHVFLEAVWDNLPPAFSSFQMQPVLLGSQPHFLHPCSSVLLLSDPSSTLSQSLSLSNLSWERLSAFKDTLAQIG